jgi:hypothetical protein
MSTSPQAVGELNPIHMLSELGVTEAKLLAALGRGETAAASCTPYHPPMAAGFYRFAETMAGLAEELADDGWTREDFRNFSTVVRPDGRVAIAVASANSGAGDLTIEVMTRSPKGVTTQRAIALNLLLPFDAAAEASNAASLDSASGFEGQQPRHTWFLLQNRRDGMLYGELSLPQAMDERGFVLTWAPRIPLTPLPLDPTVLGGPIEPPVNPTVSVTPLGTA